MKVDIRMEEGKTYDPSLYTITPTFSSALTCVSSKFQNTLQMEVTFRVDKANTSTFNWAASFDLNNQAGESLSGTSLVVSYLTD